MNNIDSPKFNIGDKVLSIYGDDVRHGVRRYFTVVDVVHRNEIEVISKSCSIIEKFGNYWYRVNNIKNTVVKKELFSAIFLAPLIIPDYFSEF